MSLTLDSAAWTGRRAPRPWRWPNPLAPFLPPRPVLIHRDELPALYAMADGLCAREGLPTVGLFFIHNPMMPAGAAAEPSLWRITIFPRFFEMNEAGALATIAHQMGHLAHRHGNGPGLAPVVLGRLALLGPGGLLAFTTEAEQPDDGEAPGWVWQANGRFRHHGAHIRAALDAAGMVVVEHARETLRMEAGQPVPGHLVVAGRRA